MKRLIASVIVVVAFAIYAIFSRGGATTQPVGGVAAGTPSTSSPTTLPSVSEEYDDDDDEGAVVAQPTAAITPMPATPSTGYADGTYTGSQANALYGVVQVQAVIQGGRITDVRFLSYPTGRSSDQINAQATPILIQEAIAAQSASVNVVSGATLTSRAFMESLQSALNQA